MTIDSAQLSTDPVHETIRMHQSWLRRAPAANPVADLVRYVRAAIPFYRGMSGADDRDLVGLPVVDRALYQSKGADFRLAGGGMASYTLTSSGSTSVPLTVTLDEAAWYAVNYHFFTQVARLAGLPGDTFRRGAIGVVFVSNKHARTSFVRPLPALNHCLYARVQMGADGAGVAALYDRLRPALLYGKPTYLLDLRAALLAQGLTRPPWSPRLLLVSGEPLHRDDRERLTRYFGAPVVDALASTEGGLVAATRPGGDTYEVFGDNVRLEVLGADGTVGRSGVGELLVTNLVYRDAVFLRYRTGDLAELATDSASGAQRLLRLWGREPRSVRLRTGLLPTEVLTDRLGFLPGVGDFQIDTGRRAGAGGVLLRWMPEPAGGDPEAVQRRLRSAIDDLLPDEHVVLERCERITPLGGKKRRFR